jgi:dihydroorotase
MQSLIDATGKVTSFTIRRLSNFHAHFRRDLLMRAVTKPLIRAARYVLVMPNTGPITTVAEMTDYHDELRAIADEVADHQVDFVMTLYLTNTLTPRVVEQMARLAIPCGVKYYPPQKGATTGSGLGVPLDQCHETLIAMTECEIPLLGHFEMVEDANGRTIEPKFREGRMVDDFLWGFRDEYPDLKKSFEHASTAKAVEWARADESGKSFVTITPQHSLFTENDRDKYGVDLDCMPCEKTAHDMRAIRKFMTSGDARVGAGGDEAPHPHKKKLEGAKGVLDTERARNVCGCLRTGPILSTCRIWRPCRARAR